MRIVSLIAACISLSACSIFGGGGSTSSATSTGEAALASIPVSGLGPQQLAAGECGLFLWSKTDPSKFIFFSKALTGAAKFSSADSVLDLRQSGVSGDIFGQFNTSMSYSAQEGSIVALTFSEGELLNGGQRIEDGLISVTDQEGWITKLPVLGVRACQPE